jgi:hypothetical protein
MSVLGKPVVRAAVYTRKSSDEGLDQEFNSLDAQHEACSAYIASQRHEGWKMIRSALMMAVFLGDARAPCSIGFAC